MDESKRATLDFIKSHYDDKGEPPSVTLLCKEIEGLSRRKFYEFFKGGVGEACKLAGVPAPKARIASTNKALKERRKASEGADLRRRVIAADRHLGAGYNQGDLSSKIVLSEEQVKRILGISHLEGGKEPRIILDELLERDTFLRENKDLSLDDTKAVFDYLGKAKERKWTIPMLLSLHVRLWNAGLNSMSSEDIERLLGFLVKMGAAGWDLNEISSLLSRSFVKDFMPSVTYDECVKFLDSLREIWLKGLTVSEYIKKLDKAEHNMGLLKGYRDKRITADQVIRTVQEH